MEIIRKIKNFLSKIFLKKIKTKSENMVVNDKETFLKKKKSKKHQYDCEWYRDFIENEKKKASWVLNYSKIQNIKTSWVSKIKLL